MATYRERQAEGFRYVREDLGQIFYHFLNVLLFY